MKWFCPICFGTRQTRSHDLAVCHHCSDELAEYELHGAKSGSFCSTGSITDVTSLWRYRGVIRDLVIRAKVRGEIPALNLLSSLIMSRRETKLLSEWCDVIIPAPSSLWGRMRGRLDIAGNLAADLMHHTRKPICSAPLELMWRWRKSALRGRKARVHRDPVEESALKIISLIRRLPFLNSFGQRTYPARILLIDDVMTSGSTLQRTADSIAREGSHIIRCLTVARS